MPQYSNMYGASVHTCIHIHKLLTVFSLSFCLFVLCSIFSGEIQAKANRIGVNQRERKRGMARETQTVKQRAQTFSSHIKLNKILK